MFGRDALPVLEFYEHVFQHGGVPYRAVGCDKVLIFGFSFE
ncbi:hypothetical protein PT277_05020 [Acetobacteraceae bacterium ESL0709]|nr:hypothetical protein [Acetobacteraceae bacterium ESL0697]MDF7678056.1 hypothetical protein [Acetobacteraceae bacterium ESL0709]